MNEAQKPPHLATLDYTAAFEAFISQAAESGVDRPRASLAAENSMLPALVNAENLPLGSLDLLSTEDRQARAIKIGREVAARVFGQPDSQEFQPMQGVEYDFLSEEEMLAGIDQDIGSATQPPTMDGYFNNEFMCFLEPNPLSERTDPIYGGYSCRPFVQKFYESHTEIYELLHNHLTTGIPETQQFKGMTDFYQGVRENPELREAFLTADRELQRALSEDDREILEAAGMSARRVLST